MMNKRHRERFYRVEGQMSACWVDDATVQSKAAAAEAWCRHDAVHERTHAGKPWRYVVIPDEAVKANRALASLVSEFAAAARVCR